MVSNARVRPRIVVIPWKKTLARLGGAGTSVAGGLGGLSRNAFLAAIVAKGSGTDFANVEWTNKTLRPQTSITQIGFMVEKLNTT